MCLNMMNIEDYKGQTKRDIPVRAFNDKYGKLHPEIPVYPNPITGTPALTTTVYGLDRDKVYTFGLRACNDLRSDARGQIDGGGCGEEVMIKAIPRIEFPIPIFRLVTVYDYYPDHPEYTDYTFHNSEKPSGKVTFELPAPVDTDLLLGYRIYANAGWNQYEPSAEKILIKSGDFRGYDGYAF